MHGNSISTVSYTHLENDDIKGIYIEATSLGAGFASREEIRNALTDFKESGKFIVAYGDSYYCLLYTSRCV